MNKYIEKQGAGILLTPALKESEYYQYKSRFCLKQ